MSKRITLDSWNRREWMQLGGVSAAAAALVGWLPSLTRGETRRRRQRIIWMFSPNGVIQSAFWPENSGPDFQLPEILQPLEPFRERLLVLKGVDNRIRGDGDDHMRGMSCLLTAIELFPGNIQGGGNTPAGWPQGHSIDQELRRYWQADPANATRFGSLECGVLVTGGADVWSRWVYAGPNQPLTPISDPRQLFRKLYGDRRQLEAVGSVLDLVSGEIRRLEPQLSQADRQQLAAHLEAIRETELRLEHELKSEALTPPAIDCDVPLEAEKYPQLSAVQQDLLVSALATDQCRLATLQYDRSVGNIRFKLLGIEEGHHELSHDPDDKVESQQKLVRINRWYAEQFARLAQRLAETPEPDGSGMLLDNTTIIWTNELGKGNSHTLNDIPFVMIGEGAGFKMGRSLKFDHLPHNRLWISLAHGLGHQLEAFGNPELSKGGVVSELFG
ncbi:MAG: DUF1552 domain-containing protein [Planctomycetota bacterium]